MLFSLSRTVAPPSFPSTAAKEAKGISKNALALLLSRPVPAIGGGTAFGLVCTGGHPHYMKAIIYISIQRLLTRARRASIYISIYIYTSA